MPTKLTQPLLQDALTRLTGWAGDEQMIHREYVLDDLRRDRLLDEIEALADSTDHTILLTDTDGGLDVSLATSDVDGVSEVDIAMASRLNDLFLLSTAIPEQRVADPAETTVANVPDYPLP
jgi:4a-hydroxytetrahydrobiopterin dehydratase